MRPCYQLAIAGLLSLAVGMLGCGEKNCDCCENLICGANDAGTQPDSATQNDGGQECTPGTFQACTCTPIGSGSQECQSNGTWVACVCGATCGDGTCNPDEDETSCPQDCATHYCGDGTCDPDETSAMCPADCSSCGNGTCDVGENEMNCPQDCSVPDECVADEWYCDGDQVRICTSDGTTSVLWQDCGDYAAANNLIFDECGFCAASNRSLCVTQTPYCTGTASGVTSRSISSVYPALACGGEPGCITTLALSTGGLTFYDYDSPFYLMVSAVDLPTITSGVPVDLNAITTGATTQVTITVNEPPLYCSSANTYRSYYTQQAPVTGTVTLTYTALQDVGDQVTLDIDGHVTCDGGETWQAITATYTALVTGAS